MRRESALIAQSQIDAAIKDYDDEENDDNFNDQLSTTLLEIADARLQEGGQLKPNAAQKDSEKLGYAATFMSWFNRGTKKVVDEPKPKETKKP